MENKTLDEESKLTKWENEPSVTDLDVTTLDEIIEVKAGFGSIKEEQFKKLLDINAEMPDLPDGDKDPFQQKTFTLHDEQASILDDAIAKAKRSPIADTGLNDNSNGNAITLICEQWLKNHG